MSELLDALRAAVVTGEIDLSEIDPVYVRDGQSIRMVVRLNWTVGQKRRRWELAREGDRLSEIDLPENGKERDKLEAQIREDVEKWTAAWDEWWAGVILALVVADDREDVGPSSISALRDSLPWGFVCTKILEMQSNYEAGVLKKAPGTPSVSSEEPPSSPPKSGQGQG